jgi:hypothetical protein
VKVTNEQDQFPNRDRVVHLGIDELQGVGNIRDVSADSVVTTVSRWPAKARDERVPLDFRIGQLDKTQ